MSLSFLVHDLEVDYWTVFFGSYGLSRGYWLTTGKART